jgi:hypothetical protein
MTEEDKIRAEIDVYENIISRMEYMIVHNLTNMGEIGAINEFLNDLKDELEVRHQKLDSI